MRPRSSTAMLVTALTAAVLVPGVAGAPAAPAAPAACSAPAHPGGEWPMYGHDLANTRHQPLEADLSPGTASDLEPKWIFSSRGAGGEGDFSGTPIVDGGCVFVGSNQGWVYAIDADSGDPVWRRELPGGGVVNNSLVSWGDAVYAYVSREGSPYVVALDRSTGDVRWETTVDEQEGSDAFGSPVVFDGIVIVGISGDAAQHADEDQRVFFRGSIVLVDAGTGDILRKTWTIPPEDWDDGYAGGTVTTTPAVDPDTKIAYVGTGSPFVPQLEHPHTNALLQLDVDRDSPGFGEFGPVYKADTYDDVVPGFSELPCTPIPLIPPPPPIVPTGRGIGACGDQDIDIAASPNLYTDAAGRLLVATSQKSGTFHGVDAATMQGVWRTTYGPLQPFGGVSAAYDGERLYGGAAPPGQLFSVDPSTGDLGWTALIGDVAHYGIPVASAGGVVLTLDVRGFLDVYEAESGRPLLHRPLLPGPEGSLTFGGVSVARNTVYAAIGMQHTGLDPFGVLDGYIVALAASPTAASGR